MPDTPGGFPYPAPTDRPDVPRDVQALAEAVDGRLGSLRFRLFGINIAVNNSATGTQQTINYADLGLVSNARVFIQPVGTTGYIGVSPSTPGLVSAVINVRHVDNTVGTTSIPVHVLVMGNGE
jgi:hypothetical protein